MKHGRKEKGKTAKASRSGKKISPPPPKAKSQAGKIAKSKTSGPKTTQSSTAKTDVKGRGRNEGPAFTNPLVAAAFRRAVKKFPTAFRRLTD